MVDLIYYSPEMILQLDYYIFPKWVMKLDIKNDSKLLYMLLLDRYKLSLKNGWIDNENRVYFIYTREEARNLLGIGTQKNTECFKELIDQGLLEEVRLGQMQPNKMYLKSIKLSDKIMTFENQNSEKSLTFENQKSGKSLSFENQNSRVLKIKSHDFRKSKLSNNDISKNYISNNIKYNNKVKIEKQNKETNKINKNVGVENESNLFDIERFINSELVKTDIARYYEAYGNAEITDNAINLLTKICNSYGVRKRKIINSFTDKAYQDLLHDSIYLVDPDIDDRSIRDKSAYLNSRIQYQIDRHLESNT